MAKRCLESVTWSMDHHHSIYAFAARAVVSTHFLFELGDKLARWEYWAGVIGDAGFPAPNAELGLVVFLLFFGSLLFLHGRYLGVAAFMLTLFQTPTTIAFEDTWYERCDSISAVGGVLCVYVLERRMRRGDNSKAEFSGTAIQGVESRRDSVQTGATSGIDAQPLLRDDKGSEFKV